MIQKIKKLLNRETVTYLIFGGLTTLVGFGTYGLFSYIGMSVLFSQTLSSALAILFAFITNKLIVFESKSWDAKTVLRELASFCAGRLATFLIETGLLLLFVEKLGFPNLPVKCVTMVQVVVGNYVISKFAVFRKPKS